MINLLTESSSTLEGSCMSMISNFSKQEMQEAYYHA